MASIIISWALTLSLLGAVLYAYKPTLFNRFTAQAQEKQALSSPTISKASNKTAKSKKSATTTKQVTSNDTVSNNDGQQGKKRKIVSAAPDATASVKKSEPKQDRSVKEEDNNLSDKDFAKQLAQTQSGASLQVPQKQQLSKKQRKAAKLAAATNTDTSEVSAEASSTNGRDADDDLTPAESPDSRPADVHAAKAGDISDMLETSTPKPMTLRLTDVSSGSKPNKSANKPFEQVLSKKKRNEKARKEEMRANREESDRMHEAKKEEQLRRARLAAGTSNQTKANNFAATANAWQSGASSAVKSGSKSSAEPLLDTFEPTTDPAPTSGAVHTAPSGTNSAHDLKTKLGADAAAALVAPSAREGPNNLRQHGHTSSLSEEDQIKLIQEQEQEDMWESVTSKKTKRKGKQDSNSNSAASSPVRAAPVIQKTSLNGSKATTATKKTGTANRFDSIQDKTSNGLQDAEWEA